MAFGKLKSSNTQIPQLFSGQNWFHYFTSLCSHNLGGFSLIIPYLTDLQGFSVDVFLSMNRTFCCSPQWWHARNRKPILPLWPTSTQLLDSLKLLQRSEKITKLPYRFDILFPPIEFNLSSFWHTWLYYFPLRTSFCFHNTSLSYTAPQWPLLRAHIWLFSFLHFLCHHSAFTY